jgi:hypothetical protein
MGQSWQKWRTEYGNDWEVALRQKYETERAQIMKLRLLVVSLLVAVLIVLLANYFGWQHEAIVISQ